MGVCFLQLFDPSTPKASNCDPTSCDYFTRKFLKIWAQICDKIFRMNKIYSFKAYFELNLDPGPKCKLKMGFFNF